MLGLKVNAAKGGFFDRAKVGRAMDSATRRALSKFGAFVRTRARTSMRRRKGTSAPGTPPFAHVGLVRKFMFFVYEAVRKSVIIGPALLNQRSDPPVPALLEKGGAVTRVNRKGERVRAVYRPRPYMGPALEAEAPQLPGLWKDSIRA